MPMTWKEACLKYNPDPLWAPKRGSEDYRKVAEIWGKENAQASWDQTVVFAPSLVVKHKPSGTALERSKTLISPHKMTKVEYLSCPIRRARIQKHMAEICQRLIPPKNKLPSSRTKNASQADV